uniref:Uncharacterized protein n=1 Tax=Anopheles coluzzii TaxID=1518534 RepID=A0A8W7PBX6_ANOCL
MAAFVAVLLDPYDQFSWIVFGLTVIAISLVLFLFGESSRYTNVMMIALEMLMAVLNGPTHRLNGRFERLVVGLFLLMSIVMISGYQSLVISFMSSARYEPQLDTFDAINDTCLFIRMTSLFLDENPEMGDRMSAVLDQIQVNHGDARNEYCNGQF